MPSRKIFRPQNCGAAAHTLPATGRVEDDPRLSLPLQDGCADLVFMSLVYHHFCDPSAVAKECHRVLRQGGHLGLWFGSPHAAVAAACPNTVTRLNGEHNAGIQVLSTRNFPDLAGPLRQLTLRAAEDDRSGPSFFPASDPGKRAYSRVT